MALTETPAANLKSICPDFNLPSTAGSMISREHFKNAKATLVMFICNHCPYVKAIETRLIDLANDYLPRNVSIVAISSNDAERYPEDSFEKMKLKNYPFPYLYDESQATAEIFGAVCTPDFFLYNDKMELTYRGRLDDSWKDGSQVRSRELRAAIEALLQDMVPSLQQKPSMGCSIKWKPGKGMHL